MHSPQMDPATNSEPAATDEVHVARKVKASHALSAADKLRNGRSSVTEGTLELERAFRYMPPEVVDQHLYDADKLGEKGNMIAQVVEGGNFIKSFKVLPKARKFEKEARQFTDRVQMTSDSARRDYVREQNRLRQEPRTSPLNREAHPADPRPSQPPSDSTQAEYNTQPAYDGHSQFNASGYQGFAPQRYGPHGGPMPFIPPPGYPPMYFPPHMYAPWAPAPHGMAYSGMQYPANTHLGTPDLGPAAHEQRGCSCPTCDGVANGYRNGQTHRSHTPPTQDQPMPGQYWNGCGQH